MNITVNIEPADDAPAPVTYYWDPDTAILTAQLAGERPADGVSGSLELAGTDGSWVILDVRGGMVRGVEVAVWPDVRQVRSLRVPDDAPAVRLVLPPGGSDERVADLQMDTPLLAESDTRSGTIHFRFGSTRPARTLRIARDICIDVDQRQVIRGIWLLNVPPCPVVQ